ncbi:sigma-54-dependent Fis family transcriptional regulator [Halalkalibacterium ligniniphilum]|uniref:sigma-54-dependent Fis family transcriptional regulator n=1 Tax=Halalkalibacterium ligniniphilum TaxID=1134413 RepID=UPI00034D6F3B|nr:sigma-54-dependent transcriptional regulator [Halalkalibacterium ligniniphilum]
MCKILFIAPYVGLKDLVLEVNKELKKDLEVYVGNLDEGLAVAKSLEHRNYDVIVSRGATAKLLRKHFSIPVMEVQLTGYDILRTLTLLNGHSGKIGMMSYLNTIQGADMIGKLLNMDITFYPIHEEKEIEEKIELASNDGVQVIIGDVISTTAAANFGIQGILITSGKEAIVETISHVEQMVYYMKRQKKALDKVQRIFSYVDDAVLIFDQNHLCTYANEQANVHFDFISQAERFTVDALLEAVPTLEQLFRDEHKCFDTTISLKIKGVSYQCTIIPFAEDGRKGDFALLLKRGENKKLEVGKEYRAYYRFNSLVACSEKTVQLIETAKKISRSQLPVLIYGEIGVGKDSLAQAIHNESERQTGPYVFVNCEAYSEAQLERELFGSEEGKLSRGVLELANGGTLFIDAIGKMPLSIQGKLLHVLSSKQMTRLHGTEKISVNIRFIGANSEPLEAYIQDGLFREDLYYALNGFTLKIPPLRERMDDLDDLIRLFIASANTTMGKQISGLRPDVIEELKKLPWSGNAQQLKHVVEQMCLISDGPFVEGKEVQGLLKKIKEEEKMKESNLYQFQNKTLEEIEQEVILSVLKQEDFNQSKAARRLGINRSTLWRKIKNLSIE